jgi:hypothetical protein
MHWYTNSERATDASQKKKEKKRKNKTFGSDLPPRAKPDDARVSFTFGPEKKEKKEKKA